MNKPSEVFKQIRFAKGEKRGKPHLSTDDEEHGAVGEVEWNQQLDHQKKRAMQEEKKDKYDEGEYDREGDMAKSDLRSIVSNAQKLHDMIDDADNLPEWVQSKITKAEDYISTVANYMTSEMSEEVKKPTGELKDACWKGYTAVGMKMKDGKKVPNCVPTNESKDMKAMRIIKDLYKKKGVKEEAETPKTDHDKWKEEYKKARAAGSSSSNAKARANGAVYEEEQVEEGMMKSMATDAEENKRLGSWRKETPWMKAKGTVTDKSGAKHTAMSTARDLARKAIQKNVKESVSITESRLVDIVREAAEKAKKKKKEETKKSGDTFQPEPELSSQIIRND